MSLSSLQFLIFVAITVTIYYLIPKGYRWIAILVADVFFLYKCNSAIEIVIWLGTALFVYFMGIFIGTIAGGLKKRAAVHCGIIPVIVLLCIFKYGPAFHVQLGVSPIGISYYSLMWIAYLLDIYWGVGCAEKNPFKFLAFAGCFPIMASGPLVKYRDIKANLISGSSFNISNITNGSIRILWGLLKKLVIADRIAVFVNSVYTLPYVYPGLFIWIATAFFVIQLYMDFSGCIDIALGTAEMFGVHLPENFDLPFVSQSLEEFWRHWHITLGAFLRDYVLYPILKSSLWKEMRTFLTKLLGKKCGKKIPVWIALLVSWFLIGFWHGGTWNYTFGVGIFFGIVIILSDMLEPVFTKIKHLIGINDEAISWQTFRVVRTWVIFGFGLLFFRAQGLRVALNLIHLGVSVFNPWILFDGSLYSVGLDVSDYHVLMFFASIVAITGIVKFLTHRSIRSILSEQNILFRVCTYVFLIFAVLIYGCYGAGFESASFIYQGF